MRRQSLFVLYLFVGGLIAGFAARSPARGADYDLHLSDIHAIWIQINRAMGDVLDSGLLPPTARLPRPAGGQKTGPQDLETLQSHLIRAHWLIDGMLKKQECHLVDDRDMPSLAYNSLENLYLESGEILDSLVACVEAARSGSQPLTPYYSTVTTINPRVSDILELVAVATVTASGYVDQGRSSALGDSVR